MFNIFVINLMYLYLYMKKQPGVLDYINNNPIIAAIAMLILNVGSKYVEIKFTKAQEKILKASLAREIILFAIVFVATKDIIISTIFTAALMILSDYIFNEDSALCICPEYLKNIKKTIDTNHDGTISEKEIQNAYTVLHKANMQANMQHS